MADNSGISFEINAKIDKALKQLDELVNEVDKIGKEANKAGKEIDNSFDGSSKVIEKTEKSAENLSTTFQKLGTVASGIFTVQQFTQYAKAVIDVRASIESLQVSFRTLLGDEQKAADLFGQIKDYAVSTPMQMGDLAEGAKTMLGFGIEANKVMDLLKQLGDISMGDSQKFQSLTLAFSQATSAGKLQGQDLLQLINAGFNPLNEIAKITGKSIAELKDDMSKGAITADMLAQALKSATSEGGMFHNALADQSQTISGALSNLQGAWDDMLNAIGEESQGVFVNVVGTLTDLIKNYEGVLQAIKAVVVAYGTYKGTLMAISALESALTAGRSLKYFMLLSQRINLAAAAQRAFNITAAANPYAVLGASALALVGAIAVLTKDTDEYKEQIKELDDKLEEQKKTLKELSKEEDFYTDANKKAANSISSHVNKIDLLLSAIHDETNSLDDRKKAIKDLQSIVPKYEASIDNEGRLYRENTTAVDEYITSLKNLALAKALQSKREEIMGNKVNAELSKKQAIQDKAQAKKDVSEAEKEREKQRKVAEQEAEKSRKKQRQSTGSSATGVNIGNVLDNEAIREDIVYPAEQAVVIANKKLEVAQNAIDIANKESKKAEAEMKKIDELQKELNVDIPKETTPITPTTPTTTKQSAKKDIEDKTKDVDKAKQDYINALENLEKDASQAEVDAQKEGAEKSLAQIKLDYENRKNEIAKRQKELIEQKKTAGQGDSLNEQETGFFDSLTKANEAAYKKNLNSVKDAEKQAQREYLEQYGSYQEQRLAIAEKYDAEIAATDSEWTKKSLEMQKQAALQQADFNSFKKNPKFALAFDSPDNASIETLKTLIQEFTNRANQGQLQGLNLEELKVWFDAANQMYDSLAQRDPFAALKESSKQLADAQNKLTSAVAKLNKAKADATKNIKLEVDSNGKLVKVEQDLTQLEAEVAQAENEVAQARSKQQKATQQATAKIDELASAISNLGNAIGGEEGEILDCIAQTMNFTTSTINSIQELATISASSISTTMKAIESASVILAIVGVAIQLMQQLSKLVGDSHKQYEEFAEKQAVINDLTTSVNDYKIAVAEAAKAEKTWFASSNGSNLREQWKVSENALESYNKKYNETQAKYVNESGGGWLTKAWSGLTSAVNWINSSASKLLGLGDVLGDFQSLSFDPLTNGINAALDSAVEKAEDFNGSMVKAFQNLRIETQAATKGFWGTGIGAKSQKTEDLTTWVKENYGEDLFRKDGMINSTLVTQIIEEQGDKLVGETKKTLEKLQEYTDKYDEFKEQLKESVSQLYSPLADDLTDALWEWYKEGTDVMDKFHEYAADTFESIAKDAIKSAVLTKLFDGYKDKIADLYEQYSYSNIDETQLMNAVSAETTALTSQVEAALPTLQAMTKSVGDAIAAAGYASDSSSQISASQRSVASMSEDAASELNGRFTALQISGNSIDTNLKLLALELKNDAKETHSYLKKIVSETEDFNDTQSDEPNVNVNVEAPQVNVNVEPNINVEPTQVTVETDTTELNNIIQQVNSAITSLALSAGNNTSILTSINSTMESAVSAITSVQMSISEGNTMLANINASVLACNGTLNAIYNTNDSGFRTLQQEIRAVASAINNKL